MEIIRLLNKDLINMIAAGEVVERPASVVKELVENSIDAGADTITVEIKNGGKTYIRVTDNGKGMSEQDARTAFIRHATSKISCKDDLYSLHTMGFRGEALAAIAAVSKVEIDTKTSYSNHGIRIYLDAGQERYSDYIGIPVGTSIAVKDLFYNIPVRMNFLKKDSTEAANIISYVHKLAIGNPEIAFNLIVDGKIMLSTSKNSTLKSVIYAVLGKDITDNILEIDLSENNVKISGYVGKPKYSRGNRNFQLFYVNGRIVKNKTITAAIDRAYHNLLMSGRHAVCIIKLDVPANTVDANVHPTKTEVKFTDDQKIFDAVYYAVKHALDKEMGIKAAEAKPVSESKENVFEKAVKDYNNGINASTIISDSFEMSTIFDTKEDASEAKIKSSQTELNKVYQPSYNELVQQLIKETDDDIQPQSSLADKGYYERRANLNPNEYSKSFSKPKHPADMSFFEPEIAFNFIGELFKTYLIVECGEYFYIVDKHAAHERMIFDKVSESYRKSERFSQVLLSGFSITLTPEEKEIALSNKDKISKMGFSFEDFGGNSIALRTIPYTLSPGDCAAAFTELIDLISKNKNIDIIEFENKALKMLSCKAAIKAGFDNSNYEMEEFVKKIIKAGNVNYCPHGRPIICEFSKNGLEKAFKRIV